MGGVMEFESSRILVIHRDAVHARGASRWDGHREPVDRPCLIIRVNSIFQRDTEGEPLVVDILHLHPHDGILRMLNDQGLQLFKLYNTVTIY